MGRTKYLGILVGVVTAALVAVGTRVRAVKSSPQDIEPGSSKNSSQKNVMGKKTTLKNQTPKPKSVAKPTPASIAPSVSNVLWREDFSIYTSKSPSATYWNIANESQPIYNEELQKYSNNSSSVRVEAGNLVLEARQNGSGYLSGMVDTKGKVKVSQGSRVEARIKLPKGRGTWPAFWLLSDNQPYTTALNPTDADWNTERFYMHDGELDIMESYGSYPGVVEATVHTFAQTYEQQMTLGDEGFHNYWMEWTAGKITMGVDSKTISTYAADSSPLKWPYTSNNQMYVILNLAMGGSGGGPILPSPTDSWRMDVSSISVIKI